MVQRCVMSELADICVGDVRRITIGNRHNLNVIYHLQTRLAKQESSLRDLLIFLEIRHKILQTAFGAIPCN